MKIQILGAGCSKCAELAANVEAALKELNISFEISKITDIDGIIACGVMITPALMADGVVLSSGKVLNKEEIKKLLIRQEK